MTLRKNKIISLLILFLFLVGAFVVMEIIRGILNDYSTMGVSNSINDSKQIGAFCSEYVVEEIALKDSSCVKKVIGAIDCIWVEKMWGIYYHPFFIKEVYFSKDQYLVIKHPDPYSKRDYDPNFKEVFFEKKGEEEVDYNFFQSEKYIVFGEAPSRVILLDVYMKALNNKPGEYLGEITCQLP